MEWTAAEMRDAFASVVGGRPEWYAEIALGVVEPVGRAVLDMRKHIAVLENEVKVRRNIEAGGMSEAVAVSALRRAMGETDKYYPEGM